MPSAFKTDAIDKHPIHRLLGVGMSEGHSAITFSLAMHIKQRLGLRYDPDELTEFYNNGSLVKLQAKGHETAITTGHIARAAAVIAMTIHRMHQDARNAQGLHLTPPDGLTPSQGRAWASLCTHEWGVITGGPGVGKTWLLAQFIDALRSIGKTMVVCAPTGKAASVLGLKVKANVTTIHRAIGLIPGQLPTSNRHNPLQVDYVFVDESSMIDELVMGFLLDAVDTSKTKVIFSGDPDQLPPVSCGAPFQVMCGSKFVPISRLTEIVRQEEGSGIIKLATSVANGRFDIPATDVTYYPCAEGSKQAEQVAINLYKESQYKQSEKMILSPVKQEKFDASTSRVNETLSHMLYPERTIPGCKFTSGDRMMFTVNDRFNGYVNGELGTLLMYDKKHKTATVMNDSKKMYDLEGWNINSQAEWAYALTIHKSQGSEVEHVIMVVTKAAPHMYTRRLIYTAVTRAKTKLTIVGDIAILRAAVARNNNSVSATSYMLADQRLREAHHGSPAGSMSLKKAWEAMF